MPRYWEECISQIDFSFDMIERAVSRTGLISHSDFFSLLDNVTAVLDTEPDSYRPFSSVSETPGGLLDFTGSSPLPVLIVPDLHARPAFFARLLTSKVFSAMVPGAEENDSVFDMLRKQQIRVICLGDGFHSETNRERWLVCHKEFTDGCCDGEAMRTEMKDSLTLMELVMRCKCAFPSHFHFLKGNHENIMNAEGGGNHPFCKFVQEGEMVKSFICEYYGDDILYLISYFESHLPLIAVCSNYIASHAEPRTAYTRQQLIDGMKNAELIEGLTWTDNGGSVPGSVSAMLKELLPSERGAVYFGGHRCVSGTYELRQNGSFIQIHNPLLCNAAFVSCSRIFDPETDILPV